MSLPAVDIQSYSLSLTRDFNAPREKVFQAWTDPDILKNWFGPKGVTTESAQIDLRVGGKYQFSLRLPDGNIAAHQGEYREIDPAEDQVHVIDEHLAARAKRWLRLDNTGGTAT